MHKCIQTGENLNFKEQIPSKYTNLGALETNCMQAHVGNRNQLQSRVNFMTVNVLDNNIIKYTTALPACKNITYLKFVTINGIQT